MQVLTTELPGVLIVEPRVFADARGFFKETYERNRYREAGITPEFVQDNLSRSEAGVVRGLHFQRPHGQGKLVRVTRGEVFDVAVDIRVGSPRFGRWFGVRLSAEDQRQVYIPPDFAHGFVALGGGADFCYKCTEYYHPESEHTLRWNDPEIAIAWPVEAPVLSEKDRDGESLAELEARGVLPEYAG
jgi:dTDP-4-dehydrorhamnose 3,5-epimerase